LAVLPCRFAEKYFIWVNFAQMPFLSVQTLLLVRTAKIGLCSLAIAVFISACNCNTECVNPPQEFMIDLRDATDSANLIANGTIVAADITMITTADGQPVVFSVTDSLIVSTDVVAISAESATQFRMTLGDRATVEFTTNFEATSKDCCATFVMKSVTFNKAYEQKSDFRYLVRL